LAQGSADSTIVEGGDDARITYFLHARAATKMRIALIEAS
jgi:hypothetical protein